MSTRLDADLDLLSIIAPGDHIIWGHGCGEPATLIEALIAQRHSIGPVNAFAASSFSKLLTPEMTDGIRLTSMGAIGTMRALAATGRLGIIPCHVGQIGRLIETGHIGCDIAMVQISPPDDQGRHSFGLINDYIQSALAKARIVIAEVNDQIPHSTCDAWLDASAIDYRIETSRPPTEVAPAEIGETDRAIAAHAARYIGDGAILQLGIGAVPDALFQLLGDRRDLGIHSGMIGDGLVDLVHAGAVTNATKPFDRGVSVSGALIGTLRLYDFAHRNPTLLLKASQHTHGDAALAALPGLVSINSAVEVDLTGQVNAEAIGNAYIGGTGGQVDYVRAASRSPGGCSIIALPATGRKGASSRIVHQLDGPVTTARSEVDIIVTEYGAAELKGQPLDERMRRMIAIAHPDFREDLSREAHAFQQRGY